MICFFVIQSILLMWQNQCSNTLSFYLTSHDVVMDCTDNLATRYLLNDACAAVGPIPLVSGSALRFDGQMTVYLTRRVPDHDAGEDGEVKRRKLADEERVPCFRCLHPTPPPAVQGCSDAGVLGVGKYACLNCTLSMRPSLSKYHH